MHIATYYRRVARRVLGSLWLSCLSGCGSDSAAAESHPWGDDVTVIGSDGSASNYAVPKDDTACVTGEGESCVKTQDACAAGAPADVLVNEQGRVIDIVCYPTSGSLTPEQIQAQNGDLAQSENGAVVVLDGVADGIDLDGDLAIDANRVVVYGENPDVSVMSGDLTVDGNNTIVRGIRMLGDVDVVKNDSAILFCAIEGNVRIVGNNTRISGCEIYGSVRIEGNNTVLSGNRIQGSIEVTGENNSCSDNRSFRDNNGNHVIEAAEMGVPLECG